MKIEYWGMQPVQFESIALPLAVFMTAAESDDGADVGSMFGIQILFFQFAWFIRDEG